jgi:hypothetical protein
MRIAKPFFTLLLLIQPRSPLGRGGLLGFPEKFEEPRDGGRNALT